MKHFAAIYFLIAISCSCSEAKGFRFGDFFFGSRNHDTSNTVKRSSAPVDLPQNGEISNMNTTMPVASEIEVDLAIINSTFEKEFVDSSLLNTSEIRSSSQNVSIFEEDNAISKQSVKKQLSNTPPSVSTTTQSVPVTEQDTSVSIKNFTSSSAAGVKVTSDTDELEEVVLVTTKSSAIPVEKTIFQKSIEWAKDTYTLSILIPVAAGVLFATTCVATIAICSCLRRCCRRRRLRKKILPDSVKNLRASDRKRLLGDCSSDEEF